MTRFEDFVISIRYKRSEENALEECLLGLEEEIGGDLTPCQDRPDHLDLCNALELTLSFKVDALSHPWLARYFAGALSADAIRQMGELQRSAIQEWEAKLKEELGRMLASFQELTDAGVARLTHEGRERAITLSFALPKAECYVVLNHHGMERQLFATLPLGIMRVLECACEGRLPGDASALQMYFDAKTRAWRFLFAPTNLGKTHSINRYIDLENGQTLLVPSRDGFIKRFHPSPEDDLKFLLSPFRAD